MPSLQQCRNLIPDGERLTDAEVEAILKTVRGLIDLAFEEMQEKGGVAKSP